MWKEDFSYLLSAVKQFIVELWELRKLKLYGSNSCLSPHSDSSGWDLGKGGSCMLGNGKNGGNGKLNVSNCVVNRNGGSGKLIVDAEFQRLRPLL